MTEPTNNRALFECLIPVKDEDMEIVIYTSDCGNQIVEFWAELRDQHTDRLMNVCGSGPTIRAAITSLQDRCAQLAKLVGEVTACVSCGFHLCECEPEA